MEEVFAEMDVTINATDELRVEKLERSAFVFITAESGSSNVAFEDLKRIEGVRELYFSRGAYDIIAKVSGESLERLREIVFKQIKALSSIKSTLTLTVV